MGHSSPWPDAPQAASACSARAPLGRSSEVLVVGGTRFLGHELAWRLSRGERSRSSTAGRSRRFGDRVERLRGDRTTADFERSSRALVRRGVDFAAFDGRTPKSRSAVLRVATSRDQHGQVYLCGGCPRGVRGGLRRPVPEPPTRTTRQWSRGEEARPRGSARPAWSGTVPRPASASDGQRRARPFRRLERYLGACSTADRPAPAAGDRPTRHVYSGAVVKSILAMLGRPRRSGRPTTCPGRDRPAELLAWSREAGARPPVDVRGSASSPPLSTALCRPSAGLDVVLDPRGEERARLPHEPSAPTSTRSSPRLAHPAPIAPATRRPGRARARPLRLAVARGVPPHS